MTIIIPEFWLWVACGAMAVTTILNVIQIRITRQHTKILQERQREMHKANMAAIDRLTN